MPREFGTDPYGIIARGPPGGAGNTGPGIGGSGLDVGRVGIPVRSAAVPGQTGGTGMGVTFTTGIGGGSTPSTAVAPKPRTPGRSKLFAKGGSIDGVAKKGKTSGKMVKMAKGGRVGGKGDGIAKRGRTKGRFV